MPIVLEHHLSSFLLRLCCGKLALPPLEFFQEHFRMCQDKRQVDQRGPELNIAVEFSQVARGFLQENSIGLHLHLCQGQI